MIHIIFSLSRRETPEQAIWPDVSDFFDILLSKDDNQTHRRPRAREAGEAEV